MAVELSRSVGACERKISPNAKNELTRNKEQRKVSPDANYKLSRVCYIVPHRKFCMGQVAASILVYISPLDCIGN